MTTGLYAILGHPLGHSLSPVLHNALFQQYGLDKRYEAWDREDAGAAIAEARRSGLMGLSVTIPHKVAVMAHLDECDDASRRIGAVNTVVNIDGRLLGSNTDAAGAIDALREVTEIRGRTVLVVGAGGVARAIGFGILDAGGTPIVINRTESRGRDLASALGCEFTPLAAIPWPKVEILVNATSVGMTPDADGIPVPQERLRNLVVFDTVYKPLETRLLLAARRNGCVVVSGLRMFVHQARYQFALWTGIDPDPAEMERLLRERLGAS